MEKWRNVEKHKQEYIPLLKQNSTICVFDVETTGIKDDSKIIQFSAQRYRIKNITESDIYTNKSEHLDLYINPREPLTNKIIKITGITDDMLSDKPDEYLLTDDILDFINAADIWVGYNVNFDIKMIQNMCKRTNRIFQKRTSIDVLEMARDFCDQNVLSEYTLSAITDYIFPEENFTFHDSDEDIEATGLLFQYFIKQYLVYEDTVNKSPVHLEKASLFINPRKQSQQRIRMHLAGDYEIGAIYYDIVKKIWSCKSNTASKRLFKSCDMQDLERQFMEMYGYRFNLNSMDEVAKSWMKFRREVRRNKQ